MEYRYGSHTVYKIEYHFVWVTKYRYQILTGDVSERIRELVRQICTTLEIRIIKGVVSKDHVHILVSAPLIWHRVRSCVESKDRQRIRCLKSFRR